MPGDSGNWLIAPPGWEPDLPNPFTSDGAYGAGWSCFQLSATDDDVVRNGCRPSGAYTAVFGRRTPHLSERLGDFLRYEASHGRSVIIAAPDDVNLEAFITEALAQTSSPTTIRPYDPCFMVHSTTREAWARIELCSELRSSAILAEASASRAVLGEMLLGDPPDYAEYVMLGDRESIGAEFVVACRQARKMLPGPDTEYEPGVRLYFDAHRIIRAGLAVRDGLHTLKVRDHLPLQPYLAAVIGVEDLPPLASGKRWTTTLFRDRANEAFARRLQGRECER